MELPRQRCSEVDKRDALSVYWLPSPSLIFKKCGRQAYLCKRHEFC